MMMTTMTTTMMMMTTMTKIDDERGDNVTMRYEVEDGLRLARSMSQIDEEHEETSSMMNIEAWETIN